MPCKASLFLLVFIGLISCESSNTKQIGKAHVSLSPIKIEKNDLKVHAFNTKGIIDSILMQKEAFSEFKTTIEDLSKLNPDGIETFLNEAVHKCDKLLRAKIPPPFDTPEIKGRLKVVKTHLLRARYFSNETQARELNQSLNDLYKSYGHYLQRIEDFALENRVQDSIVLENK